MTQHSDVDVFLYNTVGTYLYAYIECINIFYLNTCRRSITLPRGFEYLNHLPHLPTLRRDIFALKRFVGL